MSLVPPPSALPGDFPAILPSQTSPVSPEMGRLPARDLSMLPSSVTGLVTHNAVQTADEPVVRRLSVSRTWPTQPMPINTAAVPDGYPYSAPPAPGNGGDMLSQSFPPLPRPDQVAALNNHEASRRMSGNFQLPRLLVPGEIHDDQPWRRTSYQRPVSQQQHYSFPFQPGSPYQRSYSRATIHEPQPRRPVDISPPPPQEEMPLIISTPKGVSGAFDPPERRISGHRAETPILAPVPRHPRPITQSSILRPAPERLDTIFSISSSHGESAAARHLAIPPAPASTSTGGLSRRVPSLNRKPSRAERSAAKNIADAKRKGWTGMTSRSKSRRGRKKKDLDAMSTTAWTDVSTRSAMWGRGHGQDHVSSREKEKEKDKKCIVM